MNQYTPELGQAIFGQPTQKYECPAFVTPLLQGIGDELCRVMWNINRRSFRSPFENNGEVFICSVFEVHAYSWGDVSQPFNFFHAPSGVMISWYKYLGRGMSSNVNITPDMMVDIYNDCVAALQKIDAMEVPFIQDVDTSG